MQQFCLFILVDNLVNLCPGRKTISCRNVFWCGVTRVLEIVLVHDVTKGYKLL